MKKIFLFLFLSALPLSLFATNCIPDCEVRTDWTLEVRGAYINLPGKAIKKVYGGNWIDYEVEAAKRIHRFVEIWGGVDWASRHATVREYARGYDESSGFNYKETSRIFVLPVSLGVKLIYPIIPFVDIYAGAGVCYSFLKIKNVCKEDYSYRGLSEAPLRKAIYKNNWGGVFKVGFQVAMSESTFLDFFTDYYMQRFQISRKKDPRNLFHKELDCSGFKFGMGFGVYF